MLMNSVANSEPDPVEDWHSDNLPWDLETFSANINAESWQLLHAENFEALPSFCAAPVTNLSRLHLNGFNFNLNLPGDLQQAYPASQLIQESQALAAVDVDSSWNDYDGIQMMNDLGTVFDISQTPDGLTPNIMADAPSQPFRQSDGQMSQDVQSTSKSRSKGIACTICSKKFGRIVCAKRYEDRHNGVKGYPCVGVCGDPSWYAFLLLSFCSGQYPALC